LDAGCWNPRCGGVTSFVGLQMMQDREIALAGQYQERSATAVEYWNGLAQSQYDLRTIGNNIIADPK